MSRDVNGQLWQLWQRAGAVTKKAYTTQINWREYTERITRVSDSETHIYKCNVVASLLYTYTCIYLSLCKDIYTSQQYTLANSKISDANYNMCIFSHIWIFFPKRGMYACYIPDTKTHWLMHCKVQWKYQFFRIAYTSYCNMCYWSALVISEFSDYGM